MKIRVTIWNENVHEQRNPKIAELYPKGIHGAIADILGDVEKYEVRTATLDMPEHGLTDEVLDNTDVLIWWGHVAHAQVSDEVAERVKLRVLDGMGLIVLHSGHLSKPFVKLMGTICRSKWRENNEKERIWVIEPSHPICSGLPEYIELPQEETYGERFEVPAPDELVFISWFSGGEVFRSGCCYKRGLGKVFYFRPGHEAYPTFYNENIAKILVNAVNWARPLDITRPTLGHYEALEKVEDIYAGMSDAERKHENLQNMV
ncbi:MAG: trehalose utilization protein ThuA [Ruminococcaceae bacterium]|nr:trehalose utilization protein ThuA [Oscillospiraceae bacterium]